MAVTASEMKAFFERKAQKRREANLARWERARTDADAIIARIAARHRPARIWQWGSVLDSEKFTEISDIDIALEGITDPAEFFAILGEAEELTSFSLDIVQLECIEPEYAGIIRRKGKICYEHQG